MNDFVLILIFPWDLIISMLFVVRTWYTLRLGWFEIAQTVSQMFYTKIARNFVILKYVAERGTRHL